jgi:uncharacterized protein (DUF305 family)
MRSLFIRYFCLCLFLAMPVLADNHGHSGHAMPEAQTATTEQQKIIAAYQAANTKMHSAMNAPLTGDADRDFVIGMLPHHQGAVDMAKIVLQYGKDAEIRKLAQDIIHAQQKEITWMQNWLQNNPKP